MPQLFSALQNFLNEKTVFLFDGSGAVLNGLLHGLVLPLLAHYIGLPVKVHYLLTVFPVMYGCYSFFCFFNVNHKNPLWLRIIIGGNLLYCALTAFLLLKFSQDLKIYGFVYFFLEFLVMAFVLFVERKILKSITQ